MPRDPYAFRLRKAPKRQPPPEYHIFVQDPLGNRFLHRKFQVRGEPRPRKRRQLASPNPNIEYTGPLNHSWYSIIL
jgi:hypothetical protein